MGRRDRSPRSGTREPEGSGSHPGTSAEDRRHGSTQARTLIIHPSAAEEAQAARLWYSERNPAAGNAFLIDYDTALDRVEESPARWPIYIEGTRRLLFRRFPYFVVYKVVGGAVYVLAIAHGRRRPGYWRRRKPR